MTIRIVQFIAAGFLLLALATPAAAIPILEIDLGGAGSSTVIGQGDTVTASIFASGIPAGGIDPGTGGPGMFGFGFDLTFSSTGLAASNLTFGPLWTSTGFPGTHDSPGQAGLTSNRFFLTSGPFGDDILLGTIDLEGLSPGVYDLSLDYFAGPGDNLLFDGTELDGDAGTFFGAGSVSIVPEPGTAALFATGFVLLLGARRR